MSKLDDLAALLQDKILSNIEEYWEEAIEYGEVCLQIIEHGYKTEYKADIVTPLRRCNHGRRIAAFEHKGVYMWEEKSTGTILYIGKTDGKTSSIHARIGNHRSSFTKPDSHHEVTGRKYRQYLKENGLQTLDVVIKYINTADYDLKIAPLIEDASIDHYQPLLNSQIKGRGSRNEV
jgi:hypothetical protein